MYNYTSVVCWTYCSYVLEAIALSDAVKIRRIGNSLGVTLSEQVREMGLGEGDSLFVVKTRDGIELTPYDPDFAEALEAGRDFMRRFPNAMKKLAG